MSKQETIDEGFGEIHCSTPDIPPGLAWEHFEEPESVQTLWRVSYFRKTKSGRPIRCANYFMDESKAWNFAGRRIEKGDENVKVLKLSVSA